MSGLIYNIVLFTGTFNAWLFLKFLCSSLAANFFKRIIILHSFIGEELRFHAAWTISFKSCGNASHIIKGTEDRGVNKFKIKRECFHHKPSASAKSFVYSELLFVHLLVFVCAYAYVACTHVCACTCVGMFVCVCL